MTNTTKKCACGLAWEHTGKHTPMTEHKEKCKHRRSPLYCLECGTENIKSGLIGELAGFEEYSSPAPESKGMEEWEKEFDEKWKINGFHKNNTIQPSSEDIKSFIRQLILSSRQEADQRVAEAVREIEATKNKHKNDPEATHENEELWCCLDCAFEAHTNSKVDEVLEILNK